MMIRRDGDAGASANHADVRGSHRRAGQSRMTVIRRETGLWTIAGSGAQVSAVLGSPKGTTWQRPGPRTATPNRVLVDIETDEGDTMIHEWLLSYAALSPQEKARDSGGPPGPGLARMGGHELTPAGRSFRLVLPTAGVEREAPWTNRRARPRARREACCASSPRWSVRPPTGGAG